MMKFSYEGTTTHSIAFQKVTAHELLYKLEAIDPNCILAGGAPRDWYFEKPCNDLDFYIHLHGETMSDTALRFKRLGLKVKPMNWSDNKEGLQYKCMEHLHRIYEGVKNGIKFQVMVMNFSTFECVVGNFGTSVCKAWWKGGEVQTTTEFLLSHHLNIIFKKDDYTAKVLHVGKMVKRYPNYRVKDQGDFSREQDMFCKKHNIYNSDYQVNKKLKELNND